MLGILNKTQQKVQSNLKGAFGQFNLRNKSTSSVDDEDHHHPDGSVDGAAVEGKPITWGMKLRKARVAGGVRFKNVFVAPIVNVNAVLGFTAPVHFKTAEESQFLHAALEDRSFIYSRLGSAEQKALVLAFVKFPVPAGTSLYTEGEPGTHVYVLQKGSVAFSSADPTMSESSKNKGDGSVFGELALLHDAPLVSTARTTMDCILWKLEGDTARKILASYAIGSDNETKDLLKTVPLFKTLDDAFLTQIAYSLSPTTYQDGDVIYTKGEMNVSFCIVRTGMAKATDVEIGDAKYEEVIFKAGESFGALAIMNNEPAQGNVVAVGETTVLSVNRDVFLRLFGGMDKLLQASVDRKMLQIIPSQIDRADMPGYELDALVDLIVDYKFKKGHVFMKEGGVTVPALYIVRSGQVTLKSSIQKLTKGMAAVIGYKIDDTGEATVTAGGHFGSDTLRQREVEKVLSKYTITADEDCVIGILTQETLWSVISGRVVEGELNVEEYTKHKLLGAGTFGRVYLVSKKNSTGNHLYALKVQKKRALIEFGMVTGIMQERNIMVRLNHPFVIRLINSSQDDPNIYMLTDLYQGGELRSLMEYCERGMPEEAAVFYAAGILEGVTFMHARRAVHRDLKPENVLLDSDGYCVLIDLGFAKVIQNDKTFTFCGTPIYLAPEILLQKGYGRSADLWSWAVMVYEMIVSITPFYESGMDQMALFQSIVKGKYEFPPSEKYMSHQAKDLIKKMLVPNPRNRLGCQARGAKAIKDHEWFISHGIHDFVKLGKKGLPAPWKPPVKDPLAGADSEESEDDEQDAKADTPLSEAEQSLFKEF